MTWHTSFWNASKSGLTMIRYLAAAGNVLVKFHRSVLDSRCIGVVNVFGDILYLMISSPQDKPDSLTDWYSTRKNQQVQEKLRLWYYYYLSHLRVACVHFVNSFPFVTHPGVTYQELHSLAHHSACLCSNREILHLRMFLKFLSIASIYVEPVCMRPTAHRIHAATRRYQRWLDILLLQFQALIWTKTITHIIPSDTLLVVKIYG